LKAEKNDNLSVIKKITDFSLKTIEHRRKWHNIFSISRKELSIKSYISNKNIF
jgi:hypothetical protein